MKSSPKLAAAVVVALLSVCALWAQGVTPDFSTPKKTVGTFFDYLQAGDLDALPKCFVTPANDKEKAMILYGLSDDIYIPFVANALNKKFGPNPKVSDIASRLGKVKAMIVEKWDESITGDMATVTPPAPKPAPGVKIDPGFKPRGYHFKKENGAWKLLPNEVGMLMTSNPDRGQALKEVFVGIAKEIADGKFASSEEAMKALEIRRSEVVKKFDARGPMK